MSTQSVETILSRAMSEPAFADLLFSDPVKALYGYDLTADEVTILKGMSRAEFDNAAQSTPEERKSYGVNLNHNEGALPI